VLTAQVRRQIQEALRGAAVPPDADILTVVTDPGLDLALGVPRGTRRDHLPQALAQVDLPEHAAGNSGLRQLLDVLGLALLRRLTALAGTRHPLLTVGPRCRQLPMIPGLHKSALGITDGNPFLFSAQVFSAG
jgi:hypothetical protein